MAVSFVDKASATTTSLTVPTHAVDDLMIIWSVRGSSGTPPTVPAGWTSIPNTSQANATNLAGIAGYRYAVGTTNAADPSGTWTNANAVLLHIYRDTILATLPVASAANGSSNTISYSGLTLSGSGSWLAIFAGHNTAGNVGSAGVTGYTGRTAASGNLGSYDTNGIVASAPGASEVVNASGPWVSATVEISAPAAATNTGAFFAMFN